MKKSIPLVNLAKMHKSLKSEIDIELKKILDSNNFLGNKIINTMELNYAKKNNSKYCIGVSSGTSALALALEASGVGAGDEVITTTNTFFSTYESIIHTGAKPVVIDVNSSDLNINSNLIEKKINKNTKAIVPVHIYGKPSEMNHIIKIAKKYNLQVIEDCAQSHFARYDSKYVGNFSSAAAFSFYPGKNIGGFGDSGCVITNNKKIYKKILSLRDHGRVSKYKHRYVGYNYRIDAIQAAIINLKLKYIDEWNENRRNLANIYCENLLNIKNIDLLQYSNANIENVFHLFVIVIRNKLQRNKLINYMKRRNINLGIHYPIPIHMQTPVKKIVNKQFPVMNSYKDKIVSLPLCPFTDLKDIKRVIYETEKFFRKI